MRAWLVAALPLVCACSADNVRTPLEPESARPNTLLIVAFVVTGWHDGRFHYLPTVSVSPGANGGAVDVLEVSFERSAAGVTVPVQSVRYPVPRRVTSGSTHELIEGRIEIVSSTRLEHLSVAVAFVDETGRPGTVRAQAAVPNFSQGVPDAALVIRSFSVLGRFEGGRYYYRPKLSAAETTGRSAATVLSVTFELLDVGPSGRVPPSRQVHQIPAGGTVVLDEDPYGYGPWLEIDSSVDAARVAVVIAYVDGEGRGSSVSAVAHVAR
jgi:hypothetical protein